MRKILTTMFLFVLGVFLVSFFVANRQPVTINFDPISPDSPAIAKELPLFWALAGSVLIGFVLGSIGMWISNTRLRQRSSEASRRVRELEREVALAKAQPQENSKPGGTNLPALRA